MRTVDVGILRDACIKFDFIGDFMLNGNPVPSKNSVSIKDGGLWFENNCYRSLCFTPQTPECCFLLHNVVIGVGFHWQRN